MGCSQQVECAVLYHVMSLLITFSGFWLFLYRKYLHGKISNHTLCTNYKTNYSRDIARHWLGGGGASALSN